MSSPAVSVFQTVLPVNAMSIDLIERLELPPDNLYPEDHLVTSVPEKRGAVSLVVPGASVRGLPSRMATGGVNPILSGRSPL
jgi:hypothetical protein